MTNGNGIVKLRTSLLQLSVPAALLLVGFGCAPPYVPPPAPPPPAEDGITDSPEASTTELPAYLSRLTWNLGPYDLYLWCGPNECGTTGEVHLKVWLHPGSASIDPELIVPNATRRGQVIAKIVNQTAYAVREYGFTGNDQAYLFVGKTSSTNSPRALALYKFDATGAHGLSVAYRARKCLTPPYPSEPVHVLTHQYCEGGNVHEIYNRVEPPRPAPPVTRENLVQLISNTRRPASDVSVFNGEGFWFSCSLGCCQASNFGFY